MTLGCRIAGTKAEISTSAHSPNILIKILLSFLLNLKISDSYDNHCAL